MRFLVRTSLGPCVAFGALAGCASPIPPQLQIGVGPLERLAGYHALSDGDSVLIEPGAQGAQHIPVALRVRGFALEGSAEAHLRLRTADGVELLSQFNGRLSFARDATTPETYGTVGQALLLADTRYCALLGQSVRIDAHFDDHAGHVLDATVTVTVAGIDPASPEAGAWLQCCTLALPRCVPDAGNNAWSDAPDATPASDP